VTPYSFGGYEHSWVHTCVCLWLAVCSYTAIACGVEFAPRSYSLGPSVCTPTFNQRKEDAAGVDSTYFQFGLLNSHSERSIEASFQDPIASSIHVASEV
jgi:hypothetical protein